MGFLKKSRIKSGKDLYKTKVKPELAKKDGNIHVLMLDSFSKYLNQAFGVESKYTEQIDPIITGLQNDGYEIVDIKINSLKNQGLTGEMEGFHTLIMYK